MTTKAQYNEEISNLVGIKAPHMSTGSTESKDLFVTVNEILGLGLDKHLSKPDLARGIVEAAGFNWSPSYESRGSTVTREGMRAVRDAVLFFLQ